MNTATATKKKSRPTSKTANKDALSTSCLVREAPATSATATLVSEVSGLLWLAGVIALLAVMVLIVGIPVFGFGTGAGDVGGVIFVQAVVVIIVALWLVRVVVADFVAVGLNVVVVVVVDCLAVGVVDAVVVDVGVVMSVEVTSTMAVFTFLSGCARPVVVMDLDWAACEREPAGVSVFGNRRWWSGNTGCWLNGEVVDELFPPADWLGKITKAVVLLDFCSTEVWVLDEDGDWFLSGSEIGVNFFSSGMVCTSLVSWAATFFRTSPLSPGEPQNSLVA